MAIIPALAIGIGGIGTSAIGAPAGGTTTIVPSGRSVDQVLAGVLAEAPDGLASSHSPDDFLGARFRPIADAIANVEASALSMLPQIDPRQAPQLLPDWERMLGPDPCMAANPVTDTVTRGRIAYGRLTNAGTVCAGYFEAQALALGETITVTEFPGYMLGQAVCGGSMIVGSPELCGFQVSLAATDVTHWICGATQCGESLGTFTPSVMECVIKREAPLFATPYFHYTG